MLRESIPLPEGDVLLRELREYRREDAFYLPRWVELRQADVALVLAYKHYAFDSGLDASQLQQGLPTAVMRVP